MAYTRMVAAALAAAVLAVGSAQAQAPSGGCRKRCDASFSSCSKRAQAGDSVCLRIWHRCKQQCTALAQVRPVQTAAATTPAKGRR